MSKNDYLTEEEIEEQEDKGTEDTESDLLRLVRQTIDHYEVFVYPEIYEIIKMKVMFNGDLKALLAHAGNEHRACNIYPLISSLHDSYTSNTYDILPEMRAVARNPEDQEKTEQAQDFLDWGWSVGDALYADEQMSSEAILIGLSSGQVSFSKEKNDIDFWHAGEEVIETIKEDSARPSLEHVPFFEMFIDPASNDLYRSRWKFRRKIISWERVCSSYGKFIPTLQERKEEIIDMAQYASRCDYNKIWEINRHTGHYVKMIGDNIDSFLTNGNGFSGDSIVYKNMFQVDYDNDMVEVIEFRESETLKIMINGYIVYDGETIYPIKGDPFVHMYLDKLPGTTRCLGIGHKIMAHQKQINSHWNAIQDGINIHMRPMYLVEQNAIVGHDGRPPKKITWRDGETLVSKVPGVQNGGIRVLEFVDPTMIQISRDLIRQLLMEAMEIIGVNSYTYGGQGKVERSPTAVRAKTQIINSRLQQFIHSRKRMHQKTYEMWLSMATLYKGDEFNVRIFKEESGEVKYNTVTPYEIINKFDVVIENENDRLATKQERLGQTIQLLQTLSPYIYDETTGVFKIDMDDVIVQMLNTLDFKGMQKADLENMKKQIKEKFDLAMYQQELQAEAQPQPPAGGMPGMEGTPGMSPEAQPVDDRLEGESLEEYVSRGGSPEIDYIMP